MTPKRARARSDKCESVTIRLPAHVLSRFKESGPGYQTRIREALVNHIEREERLEAFERTCAKLRRLSKSDRKSIARLKARPLDTKAMRDPFDALSD